MSEPKTRVLIVDSEPTIRDGLAEFLDDYGFETGRSGSAQEARDLLRETPFQVCIVSLRLPGFSGEEFIQLAHNHFPSLKYIIHTTALDYHIPSALKEIGIRPEHVFHKPISALDILVKTIVELAGH